MNWKRVASISKRLREPHTLARVAKTGVVLLVEVALAPWFCAAAMCLPAGPAAERLLLAQNRLRRLALWWIFPDFR